MMSRTIINRRMVFGVLSSPLALALTALAVLALTAVPVRAADPVIVQVLGIDHDAVINGKTNITARVDGDADQVVFALSGPLSRTTVRTQSPYAFLTNDKGDPRYWNTANAPEGAYTMRIRAMKDGVVADSVTVNFTIDHDAVEQNSLARKQRARTNPEADAPEDGIVVPVSASASSGELTDAKRSTQPVVDFAADAPDTFERGSGEDILIDTDSKLPGNADILAIAWDHDRGRIVSDFAHLVDKDNPSITSDKLELLPDGRMQLQLLYRERSVIQYKKLHDVRVFDPADAVDIGIEQPDPAIVDPTRIVSVSGIQNGATVSGSVKVEVTTSGDTPDEVVFSLDGPTELTHIENGAPYVLLGDNNVWDTTKAANGSYSLTVTTLADGDQTDTVTMNFTVSNAVITQPDPVVSFPSTTPAKYRLGQGIDIPYTVKGELPDNATVLVLVWSSATWGMVDEFAHHMDQGPWVISAQKMSLLQPGRTQLQLLYRVDNKTIYKRTHDLELLPAYVDEPVTDPVVNDPVVDEPVVNNPVVEEPVVDDQPVVDNGGSTGGTGGGTGTGGSAGEDTGGDTGADTGNNNQPVAVDNPDQSNILGMNLSFVTYWTREWVFTNVLRQSRGWISTNTGGNPWDNGGTVETDAYGWPLLKPGQAAATIMLNAMNGRYPGGKYICTYDGEGDIVFGWDAKNGASQPGRIEVNVTPTDTGIYMRIENANPDNPVRNVKVVHEDLVDHPSSFHPLFVERLKPFKTLRFMDWQRTNTTHQRVWSDRITPRHPTQGERGGVAIELMIELANELGADPWFCMPAQADDDYIRRFAQMVKDRLHPDAKVYVEWSNEVWNTQFEVHKWIKSETDNQSLSMPFFDKWAAEAKRDFDIWTSVWGADSDRVVRVAASQAALSWGTGKLLERMGGKFDAVALATYFGLRSHEERELTSSTSVDDIIAILDENIVTDNRRYYTEHSNLAKEYSAQLGRPIKLVAYEGGQHLADGGQNKPHKAALIAAQDDPRMYDLYQQNMLEFERAGGTANVMFNYVGRRDQWGSWGHLQYQDQPTDHAIKFKAILDYPGSVRRLELTTFD